MTDLITDEMLARRRAERAAQRAREASLAAPAVSPDDMARADRYAREQGAPPLAVADNLADFDQRDHLDRVQRAAQDAPGAAGWLSRPENVALVKDDLDGVVSVSKAANRSDTWFGAVVANLFPGAGPTADHLAQRFQAADVRMFADTTQGAADFLQSSQVAGGVLRKLAELGARDALRRGDKAEATRLLTEVNTYSDALGFQRISRQAAGIGREAAEDQRALIGQNQRPSSPLAALRDPGNTLRYYGGLFADSLPAMLAAMATRNPTAASAAMGATTGAATYADARGEGKGKLDALKEAIPQAGIEAVFSRIPFDEAFRPGVSRFVRAPVAEALSEGVTEIAQTEVSDVIRGEVTPTREKWLQAMDAMLVGAPGGLAEAALGGEVPDAAAKRWVNVARLTHDRGYLDSLVQAAQGAKLFKRSPARFEDLLQEQVGDSVVYVPAEDLEALFQSENLDPGAAVEALTGDANAWAEAQAAGGAIAIPLARYVTRLGDAHAALAKKVTLDADSVLEAEDAADLQLPTREQIHAEIESALAEARTDDARDNGPAGQVYDEIYGQLLSRTDEKSARQQAAVVQSLYRNLAERVGTDAMSLWQRFRLNIGAPKAPATGQQRGIDLAMDPLIEAALSGKTFTDRDIYGGSLVPAIVALGGINPDSVGGGDLRAADAMRRPGLVSMSGMTVERMAETLADNGWRGVFANTDEFGRPDYRELVDLIRDELGGSPVYNRVADNDKDAMRMARREAFRRDAEAIAGIFARHAEQTGKPITDLTREEQRALAMTAFEEDPGALDQGVDPAAARAANFERWANGAPLVESEAFRAWFGDSKVVDADGKPLVVYHGTDSAIEAFRGPAWFAEDVRVAHGFIGGGRRSRPKAKAGSNILPTYLAIQNPLDLSAGDVQTMMSLADLVGEERAPELIRATAQASLDAMNAALASIGRPPSAQTVDTVARSFSDRRPLWMWLDDPQVIEALQALGYDGVKVREGVTYNETEATGQRLNRRRDEAVAGVTWLAFRPEQVKSATGNRGTFDPNDPNILFQSENDDLGRFFDWGDEADGFDRRDGAPVDAPAFRRWFGASQVVDGSGMPLTVYHGTADEFTAFDPVVLGGATGHMTAPLGFFFAEDRDKAQRYAEKAARGVPADERVIDVHLSIQNAASMTTEELLAIESREEAVALRERLQAQGHDGIHLADIGQWVAFDPAQIKSASKNRGTYDPSDPDMLFQSEATGPFYSAALRAVEQGKGAPKRGDATAWKGWLDGAVRRGDMKQSERDWLGIDAWLDGRPSTTREELADFIRANEVQVEEVTLGGEQAMDDAVPEDLSLWLEDAGYDPDDLESSDDWRDVAKRISTSALEAFDAGDQGEFMRLQKLSESATNMAIAVTGGTVTLPTRFESYQLPGGENYRELLLTLPHDSVEARRPKLDALNDELMALVEQYGPIPDMPEQARAEANRIEREYYAIADAPIAEHFRSSHFDQPNILAHVRFNERTDADGKRVLFLEEIQSDWHQAGRKGGYLTADAKRRATTAVRKDGFWEVRDQFGNFATNIMDYALPDATEATALEVAQARLDVEPVGAIARDPRVPDAPFKGTDEWAMLAFKRMVRWAAENGFERIAWTTGEQQAARYDLSKQVSYISATRLADGDYAIRAGDHRGDPVPGLRNKRVPESELEGLLGKELAEKIIKGEGGSFDERTRERTYRGLDLKVGGNGMRAFYDKILPSAVNKWAKRFGGKVGESALPPIVKGGGVVIGARGPTVHSLDLTDTMRETALAGQPLFQKKGGKGPRGSITGRDGKSIVRQKPDAAGVREFNIQLLDGADVSTFLHESAHAFLEILGDLAEAADAPQQVKDDWSKTLAWLGVSDRKQIGRDQHEQWARGWEAYYREGKAPSSALRRAFAQFKVWLTAIYKSALALDVNLTNEVRGVFDRMLASDAEIAMAREQVYQDALIGDALAVGMTEAEHEAYQRAVQTAREEQEAELAAELLKAEQRAQQAWWRAERRALRAEVEAEFRALPVYRAIRWLRNGKLPDGQPVPQAVKLDKEGLLDEFGQSFLQHLRGMYATSGGVSADQAAALLGFASGGELVHALVNAPPLQPAIDAETDARMAARHPDPLTDGSLPDRAMAVVHSDKQAEVMLREIRAIEGHVGGQASTTAELMREVARRLISEKRARDIQPNLYRQAEAKAGREAFKAAAEGDWPAALAARRRQLLNLRLYQEATRVRAEAASIGKYLARFTKAKARAKLGKAGHDYLEQIDGLLERFDFRAVSNKASDRRARLRDWIQSKRADGVEVDLPAKLLDDAFAVPFRDLTVADLRMVRDAVKHLAHLADLKNTLLLKGQRLDREAVDEAMAASVRDAHATRPDHSGDTTPREKARTELLKMRGVLAAATDIARELDGFKDVGAVWSNVVQVIREAMYERVTPALVAAQEAMAGIYTRHYSKDELRDFKTRRFIPEVGDAWSKDRLLALALNWGNEGNREAILTQARGRLTPEQVGLLLSRLDERDWRFVQEVWDYVDSYWPAIAESQKQRKGLVPEKVPASPFAVTLPDGRQLAVKGGYFPLRYVPNTTRGLGEEADDFFDSIRTGRFSKASTKDGHTIERVGSGGRSVMLELSVVDTHLRDVIRDLHLGDAVNYVYQALRGPKFRAAVDDAGLMEYHKALEMWLKDVAAGEIGVRTAGMRTLRAIRTNFTASVLTFKATSAFLQLTGLVQTSVVLGKRHAVEGVLRYSRRPRASAAYVDAASPFMASRVHSHVEAVQRVMDAEAGRFESGRQAMIRWGFWMIGRFQRVVDLATWLGAEAKGMELFGGDVTKARAYADDVVSRAQGSGEFIDKTPLQRGSIDDSHRQSEIIRASTVLMSYMMAKSNAAYGRTRVTDFRRPKEALKWAGDMLNLFVVEGILATILRAKWPDDEEDDGTWDEWLAIAAREGAGNLFGGLPGLSQMVTELRGYDAKGVISSAWESVGNAIEQAKQGELDAAAIKSAVSVAGFALGIPSSQINTTINAIAAEQAGEDVHPFHYLVGPPKKAN